MDSPTESDHQLDPHLQRQEFEARLEHEFDSHFREGAEPTVEEWIDRHPTLKIDQGLRLSLIKSEYLWRKRVQGDVDIEEYKRRFPDLSDELSTLLPSATASKVEAERPEIQGFQVFELLGGGTYGSVYHGRQTALNRSVAIKVMKLDGHHGESSLVQRFVEEAAILAKLAHPQIVQVYEAGLTAGGVPYMAMELVQGGNLRGLLRRSPVEAAKATNLATQLAEAVHFAHTKGIIHRDLKPENLLCTEDGTLKVADFGLAKFVESSMRLTQAGDVLGTLLYAAPEQLLGQSAHVDGRADVYSIGAILYEMLSGRRPHEASSIATLIAKLGTELPANVDSAPHDLMTICLKCLQVNPQARYGSARELADDLERFQQGNEIKGRRPGLVARSISFVSRRPLAFVRRLSVAVLMLCAIGALGYWYSFVGHRFEYYEGFSQRWGVPFGQKLMSRSEALGRDFVCRLTRAGRWGKVVRAEVLDSELRVGRAMAMDLWGVPFDREDDPMALTMERPVRVEYVYTGSYVQQQWVYDTYGRLMYRLELRPDKLNENGNPTAATIRVVPGSQLLPTIENSRVFSGEMPAVIKVSYSPEGWEQSVAYYDALIQRMVPPNCVAAEVSCSEFDAEGNWQFTERYDTKGARIYPDALLGLQHNERVFQSTFLNRNREPYSGAERVTLITDDKGNPMMEQYEYYDIATKEYVADWKKKFTRGSDGRLTDISYMDKFDQPMLCDGGYTRIHFEDTGRKVKVTYFDGEKPTVHRCACGEHTDADEVCTYYDDRGRITSETFSLQGKLRLTRSYTYDERGRLRSLASRDGDGKPRATPYCADREYQYDEISDVCTRELYTNYDWEEATWKKYELSRSESEIGTTLTKRFWGEGMALAFRKGFHQETYVFNVDGQLTEYEMQQLSPEAQREWKNSFGPQKDINRITQKFVDGKLTSMCMYRGDERVRTSEGWDEVCWHHNDDGTYEKSWQGYQREVQGFTTVIETYNRNEEVMAKRWEGYSPIDFGFSSKSLTYDMEGRVTESVWKDADGELTVGEFGYSIAQSTYVNETETRTIYRGFDSDAKVASARECFNPVEEFSEYVFYNEKDEPTIHSHWRFSKAKIKKGEWHLFDLADQELPVSVAVGFVYPGGQGKEIGLQKGDILLSYRRASLSTTEEAVAAFTSDDNADFPTNLEISRNGKNMTLQKQRPGKLKVQLLYVAGPKVTQ